MVFSCLTKGWPLYKSLTHGGEFRYYNISPAKLNLDIVSMWTMSTFRINLKVQLKLVKMSGLNKVKSVFTILNLSNVYSAYVLVYLVLYANIVSKIIT